MDLAASLDGALKEHLEKATVFKGTSKTVQHELLGLIYSKEEFSSCFGAVDLFQVFMENNLEEVFSLS